MRDSVPPDGPLPAEVGRLFSRRPEQSIPAAAFTGDSMNWHGGGGCADVGCVTTIKILILTSANYP
ncbi:hypothetical protein AB0I77_17230 [Streptomyces sp. NPDC050619]|uniref:hypothetical protein n=1 Tax=Streptomyces sp. NPDC050619 TaxID=3157214 RepID=UPI0034354D17